MRILVLLAIFLLLYVIISNLLRRTKTPIENGNMEKMVECDLCGLHVAEREAVQDNGQYFCCQSHLQFSKRKNN